MAAKPTILGPLTTVFIPNPTCTTPIASACGDTTCRAWMGQTCGHLLTTYKVWDQASCWPPTTNGAPTANVLSAGGLSGWGLYSPGLSCPVGYVRACSKTASDSSGFVFQFPPTGGETAVGCCPSQYTCTTDVKAIQTCKRFVTSGVYTVERCSGYADPGTTAEIRTASGDTTHMLFAPMIQMIWQASDLDVAATSRSTVGVAPTTGQIEAPARSGLDTGAKAGIGVGAALAGLLVLGGVVGWFILSRRRRKGRQEETGGGSVVHPKTGDAGGQQLDSNHVFEAGTSGQSQTYELLAPIPSGRRAVPEQHQVG
ncbi:hypothetical protein PG985_002992 [Apiospora marii]|uniref:Uncharacterized protein n=1 Tax=Apiospora marii TaxID=335849 RepID=A0ABR1RUI8_9PEZI